MDVPILTCTFFIFNWLTLTSEMHFVKFHAEVASCLLSRGKRKYAPLGMRPLWKYIRNYFLVYQLISHFLLYLQNYKEFEAEILDLQSEKYGLSFDVKKYTTSGWALGDENVIGIRPKKKIVWLPLHRPTLFYSPTQTIFYWKIFFFSQKYAKLTEKYKTTHVIIFAFFDIPVTESMVWYSRYEYRIRIHRDRKSALPSGYYCYSVNIAISYAVYNS